MQSRIIFFYNVVTITFLEYYLSIYHFIIIGGSIKSLL